MKQLNIYTFIKSRVESFGSDAPKVMVLAVMAVISVAVAIIGAVAASASATRQNDLPIPEASVSEFITASDLHIGENTANPVESETVGDAPNVPLSAETVPLPLIVDAVTEPPVTEPPAFEAPPDSAIPAEDNSDIVSALAKLESDYPDVVLTLTEDGGFDYLDRVVFLGDSTTYGLLRYGVLSGGMRTNQVWTPKSGTLTLSMASYATIVYPEDGSEITIADAVSRKKPEIMVITLGVNGISFMNEEDFKRKYGELIDSVVEQSPDTLIILQSIFPVARSYQKPKSINNDKIAAANSWICALAVEKGVKYANTAAALIGEDGYLPEEYQNGDGLHLNYSGYEIELAYLSTHMIDGVDLTREDIQTSTTAPRPAPVTEPPETAPPVTEPPVTEPQEIEPPVTEPPEIEPPEIEPPEVDPIETEPPETEPEETTADKVINDKFIP